MFKEFQYQENGWKPSEGLTERTSESQSIIQFNTIKFIHMLEFLQIRVSGQKCFKPKLFSLSLC